MTPNLGHWLHSGCDDFTDRSLPIKTHEQNVIEIILNIKGINKNKLKQCKI